MTSNEKFITVVFHKNMGGERNNLINNNYTIKQNLPSRCYPGVPKNMNIYSNFLFYGKIIDNVMDTNELLLRI